MLDHLECNKIPLFIKKIQGFKGWRVNIDINVIAWVT